MKPGLKRLVGVTALVLLAATAAGCNSSNQTSNSTSTAANGTSARSTSANNASTRTSTGKVGSTVGADLMRALNTISRRSLTRQRLPAKVSLQSISGPTLGSGKPVVLYIGADFCPYCAALRWPLVVALLRFGNFDGLRYMRSSSTDVYADTVTFSFDGAHYHSDYIRFDAVDIADRQGHSLNKPSDAQQAVFQRFDAPPYTKVPGAIPFVYIGGRYVENVAPFMPNLLSSLSWQNVARQLKAGQSDLSNRIISAANVYTAAICELTGEKPASVCNSPAVKAAAGRLPDK
ncbi:MAG TPA: DUF929 family protein [Gammaproteobacteria bacterium]|nr:DUF929 family protein [Gammaproteobacteria bacterium]